MDTCKECGKGFCQSRVRRVFGNLPAGFCSAGCYTNNTVNAVKIEHDMASIKARETADTIIGELFVAGFISDNVMGSESKTAEAVDVIAKVLKGE